MLPKSLALVDDDAEFSEFLAQYLREHGVDVTEFADSDDLVAAPAAFDFEFYVLDLNLKGIDGVDLIRLLRRRSNAGILVVSGRVDSKVFESVLSAGADMYLAKPVRFEQVELAIRAVQRRAVVALQQASSWTLDRRARTLIAPDGARVDLSDADFAVLECFVDANGQPVTREALRQRLGRSDGDESDNLIHATIYRLRRRIERATPLVVPLQSQSRVGYLFRGTLIAS